MLDVVAGSGVKRVVPPQAVAHGPAPLRVCGSVYSKVQRDNAVAVVSGAETLDMVTGSGVQHIVPSQAVANGLAPFRVRRRVDREQQCYCAVAAVDGLQMLGV